MYVSVRAYIHIYMYAHAYIDLYTHTRKTKPQGLQAFATAPAASAGSGSMSRIFGSASDEPKYSALPTTDDPKDTVKSRKVDQALPSSDRQAIVTIALGLFVVLGLACVVFLGGLLAITG